MGFRRDKDLVAQVEEALALIVRHLLNDGDCVWTGHEHLKHLQIRILVQCEVIGRLQEGEAREVVDQGPVVVKERDARCLALRVRHDEEVIGDLDPHEPAVEASVSNDLHLLRDCNLFVVEGVHNLDQLRGSHTEERVGAFVVIRSEAIVNQRREVKVEDVELSAVVSKGRIDINPCIISSRLFNVFYWIDKLLLSLLISFQVVRAVTFLQPPRITVTCAIFGFIAVLLHFTLTRITFFWFQPTVAFNWSVHGQRRNSL